MTKRTGGRPRGRRPGEVSLARALSKLGAASRAEAESWIRAGRVSVGGRVVRDPARPVRPERSRLRIDGGDAVRRPARVHVLLHKPRGYLTSRRDPEGRPVVHDLLRRLPERVVPVGRLDLASSGLLLLTNDTRLADWITAPSSEVRRVYLVTVRGEVTEDQAARLRDGVVDRGEMLAAAEVTVRKRSRRESHLTVVLREGKNREVRRLLRAAGREVTRLKRVALGGLDLGDLPPGRWRRLSAEEIDRAFPGAAPRDPGGRRTTRGRPR